LQCVLGSGVAGIGDKTDDGRFEVSSQLP
jgi:hypothetical protein